MKTALSYWEKECFFKDIDLAIIGCGIVGLNAAIATKEKNPTLNVAIIERGAFPLGASTRNAGFACFGSLSELIDDLNSNSEEEILALVEKRWRGLQRLRERVGDETMEYEGNGGFEIFQQNETTTFDQCKAQIGFWNEKVGKIVGSKAVYKITDEKIATFGFENIGHIIHNTAEGQIHTGKMMVRLMNLAKEKGVIFHFGLDLERVEETKDGVELISTMGWSFHVGKVLICTNGFAKRILPDIDVTPGRNQVLVTQPIAGLKVKGCFHYDRGYYYFRNIGDRILLGGGRNLNPIREQTDEFGFTSLVQQSLQKLMQEVILPKQKFEVDIRWSGILGLGKIKKPIVQKVSPNIGVAVRMGGMGVAIGSLIGEEAAEMML